MDHLFNFNSILLFWLTNLMFGLLITISVYLIFVFRRLNASERESFRAAFVRVDQEFQDELERRLPWFGKPSLPPVPVLDRSEPQKEEVQEVSVQKVSPKELSTKGQATVDGPDGVKVACIDSLYFGSIVEIKAGWAIQDVGRGNLVAHRLDELRDSLGATPHVGDFLEITVLAGGLSAKTKPKQHKSPIQR